MTMKGGKWFMLCHYENDNCRLQKNVPERPERFMLSIVCELEQLLEFSFEVA